MSGQWVDIISDTDVASPASFADCGWAVILASFGMTCVISQAWWPLASPPYGVMSFIAVSFIVHCGIPFHSLLSCLSLVSSRFPSCSLTHKSVTALQLPMCVFYLSVAIKLFSVCVGGWLAGEKNKWWTSVERSLLFMHNCSWRHVSMPPSVSCVRPSVCMLLVSPGNLCGDKLRMSHFSGACGAARLISGGMPTKPACRVSRQTSWQLLEKCL